jgi:hypothetical protein
MESLDIVLRVAVGPEFTVYTEFSKNYVKVVRNKDLVTKTMPFVEPVAIAFDKIGRLFVSNRNSVYTCLFSPDFP